MKYEVTFSYERIFLSFSHAASAVNVGLIWLRHYKCILLFTTSYFLVSVTFRAIWTLILFMQILSGAESNCLRAANGSSIIRDKAIA
uniref:Uncharacterized protein n=1 Tax=Arundo donax TaxID=35708 RepID=A0A0A9CWN4_ARUDO